ncbi:MAG: hypothetical protein J07HR59_00537 [Halorubrum sp. J07HR59]|nr:MAG: hypothetical protein J07HR59_00537 [Halorubrum sp. J07HR59]
MSGRHERFLNAASGSTVSAKSATRQHGFVISQRGQTSGGLSLTKSEESHAESGRKYGGTDPPERWLTSSLPQPMQPSVWSGIADTRPQFSHTT